MTALFTERRAPFTWAIVFLLALLMSYGVAEDPLIAIATIGLVGLVVVVLLAAAEPRWALVVLVFGAYATLFEAAQNATGLPLSKRLAIVGVAALLVWRRAEGSGLPLPALRDALLAAALLGVMALSAVSAAEPATTFAGLASAVTAAVVALLVSTLREPVWLARGMWSAALGGALLALLSLHQQAAGAYDSTYFGLAVVKLDAGLARSGGPFEPNFFAQALVLSFALALYLTLRAARTHERIAGICVAAACVGGIAATASRGGALALGVVLALMIGLRRPRLRVLVPVAALAVAAALVLLPQGTGDRISSLASATDVDESLVHDTSFRGRFAENVTAVHMLQDNPLLGVGSSNFAVRYADYATFAGREWRPVRQAHNLYLEAFAETGVVGGTVLLVLLAVTLGGAWNARRYVPSRDVLLAEGVFVGLAGVLTTSLFLHASFLTTLWTGIGLAWAAAAMGRAAAARAGRDPA